MTTVVYTLVVRSPEDIDPDTMREIDEGRSGHDLVWHDAVARWLGGKVNDAENALADDLPEGWSVKVSAA